MRLDRKKAGFAILCFLLLLPLSYLFAATRNVPSDYSTIQAGVDAASAGDTVEVAFGTYTGRVVVRTHGITLQGAGAGRTFLNLSGTGGIGVTFENVTGSTIRGFTIKRADAGVRASNSKAKVTNNIFIANNSGFENYASYSHAVNNTFYGNTKAVFTNSSSTLTNNIFSKSKGYAVTGSEAGSIRYNLFNENAIGNYSGFSAPPSSFNNITGRPLFVSVTSDFHLRSGSPAIKRGDPALKNSFNNLTSDIGTYGGPNADAIPATIEGVTATSYTDRVTISWNKNLAYNIAGYKVYYGTSSGSYPSSVSAGDVASVDLTAATLTPETRYYFSVRAIDSAAPANEGLDSVEQYGAIDNTPPGAPANLKADIGDSRLYLSWDAVTDNESGTKGYKVHWDTASGTYANSIDIGNNMAHELSGLTNGTLYYIAVAAYDNAGNEGDKSAEVAEIPEEIRGIMGLKNSGGCFIATAAYGSYEERHVKLLREFRDRYLLTNSPGRGFVSFYYATSPPLAEFITEHSWLKPFVRVALLPLIAFSWLVINHPLPSLLFTGILIAGALFLMAGGRKSGGRRILSPAPRSLLLALLLLPFLTAISFGGEKSGPYLGISYGRMEPASDEWKDIYSDEQVQNFRVSIGYRPHPTIGVEIGGGYLAKEGEGRTITGRAIGVETTFQSAPVDFTLLYRLNYFQKQLIIPYIGGGISYNPYWEGIEDGKKIKGGMWGRHATGGVQFFLNSLDRKSARDLREDYGIDNTYLTIGATQSVVDDFNKEEIDLGGLNYSAGLLFEF